MAACSVRIWLSPTRIPKEKPLALLEVRRVREKLSPYILPDSENPSTSEEQRAMASRTRSSRSAKPQRPCGLWSSGQMKTWGPRLYSSS